MKKASHILFLGAVVLMSSCSTVYFQSAQPKDLGSVSSFPAEWRGEYRIANDGGGNEQTYVSISEREVVFTGKRIQSYPYQPEPGLEAENGDSVQIMAEEMLVWGVVEDGQVNVEYKAREVLGLSDSLVLKVSPSGTILNLREEKEEGAQYFIPFLVERLRNDDLILWGALDEKEAMAAYFPLSRKTVQEGDAEVEYFLANPGAQQWSSFLKAGGMKDVVYWLERQ